MKKYEAMNDAGEVVGVIRSFRAPAFTGKSINYSASDVYGNVIGCAEPTIAGATAKLGAASVKQARGEE